MTRPDNPLRKNSTMLVSKAFKMRLRRHAQVSDKRKGTESSEQIMIRILDAYEKTLIVPLGEPRSTY